MKNKLNLLPIDLHNILHIVKQYEINIDILMHNYKRSSYQENNTLFDYFNEIIV